MDGANYQLEMMRCLREVNVDNNTVGWCAHLLYAITATVSALASLHAQPAHIPAARLRAFA